MRKYARYRSRGASIAELPIALGLFLLVIFLPLLDLGTVYFGASSVFTAARVAAVEAARAGTFSNDTATSLSAVHIAQQKASSLSTGGVDIAPEDVQVSVLQVPVGDGDPAVITPSATFVADTSKYVYQIRVLINGRVSPLVTLSTFFGHIPGLTEPMVIQASSTATCENPDGLAG